MSALRPPSSAAPLGHSRSVSAPSALPRSRGAAAATPTASSPFAKRLEAFVEGLAESQRALDGRLERLRRNGDASPGRLIDLQGAMYRATLELEVTTRVVDAAKDGVEQVLQSQR